MVGYKVQYNQAKMSSVLLIILMQKINVTKMLSFVNVKLISKKAEKD